MRVIDEAEFPGGGPTTPATGRVRAAELVPVADITLPFAHDQSPRS
jgi:hypothetical protein